MKNSIYLASFAITILVSFSTFARPITETRCQTQSSEYSSVKVCANVDVSNGQVYLYDVTYQGGLLNSSSIVYLGGVRECDGYRSNIYDGTLDWSNKVLVRGENSASLKLSGSFAGTVLSIYFQSDDGRFDSRFGQNYRFQF